MTKAKKYFSEVQEKGELQGKIMNNLGCAQWWHIYKFHEDKEILSKSTDQIEEFKRANLEFVNAVPNFQRAISTFEGLDKPYELETEALTIKNPLSGLAMTNIAELFYQSNREEVISYIGLPQMGQKCSQVLRNQRPKQHRQASSASRNLLKEAQAVHAR
jgi:hypothetical protein